MGLLRDNNMSSQLLLLIFTLLCLAVSLIADRKKTAMGLKKGVRMFLNILPSFITVLILVSAALAFISPDIISRWLGKGSGALGFMIAAAVGSISLIPGFVAYPLGAILVKNGVSYSIIAVFITTLMMVGIVTLPLEARYFGWRVSITRNVLSFIGAIVIGIAMGLLWGIV
jgi:uncharacterized membrane protein YraQ (UPF0718 family)